MGSKTIKKYPIKNNIAEMNSPIISLSKTSLRSEPIYGDLLLGRCSY